MNLELFKPNGLVPSILFPVPGGERLPPQTYQPLPINLTAAEIRAMVAEILG